MIQPQNITDYFIETYIKPGSVAIDATAGNGNDTLKLCKAVGKDGKVFAFDIQETAVKSTKKLLEQNKISNAEIVLDSHSNMDLYVKDKVNAVIFNLGYLPGSDHSIHTKAETTTVAIEKSLELLSDDGFVSVTVYYGKNSGTEEKNAVMDFLSKIDHKKYTVLSHDFLNRPNNPPITVIITANN